MKFVLLVIFMCIFAGCTKGTVSKARWDKAENCCKANGGVILVDSYTVDSQNAYCVNGAVFNLNDMDSPTQK